MKFELLYIVVCEDESTGIHKIGEVVVECKI